MARQTSQLSFFLASVSAVIVPLGGAAFAQEAATVSPAQVEAQNAGTDIVVTAQRRREDIQRVPIAVTALTPAEIAKKNIVSIMDVQAATPSLSVTPTAIASQINIRGIGMSSTASQVVNGVALYRDGIFQTQAGSFDPFYDIASIEVLRGPQGTFVGSNSTGGAVFINSASARIGDNSGYVQAQYGNYADHGFQGAYNRTISDTLAVRVAANYESRDSFYKSIGVGGRFSKPGSLNVGGIRGSVSWKPDEHWDILFKVEATNKDSEGFAWTPIPEQNTAAVVAAAPSDPFVINFDTAEVQKEYTRRPILDVRYQFTPGGVTLRSLTGYNYLRVDNVYDNDATSLKTAATPASVQYQDARWHVFQQETTLVSPDRGSLRWVLGAFYLHNYFNIDINQTSQTSETGFASPSATTLIHAVQQTMAAFGRLQYYATKDLQFEVGLRYAHDDINNADDKNAVIRYSGCTGTTASSCSQTYFVNGGRQKDDLVTGKVGVNWQMSPEHFLYAFAARGGKQGGVNGTGSGAAAGQRSIFSPEKVNDYEIGIKSSFFGGLLKTQFGGFYMNYDNLQSATVNTNNGQSGVFNVGDATIKGLELSAQARYHGFSFDANLAYVDSKLGRGTAITGTPSTNQGPQCPTASIVTTNSRGCSLTGYFNYIPYTYDFTGNRLPYAPKITGNFGVAYTLDVGKGQLTPRVDYAYTGSQWATPTERPGDYFQSRGIWAAKLSYDVDNYHISLYGQNIFDKTYKAGQQRIFYIVGAPRTVTLKASIDI